MSISRLQDFLNKVKTSGTSVAVNISGVGALDGKIAIDGDMVTFVPDIGAGDYVMHFTEVCVVVAKPSP